MKHARKLASLLLALVMVFALATTAFAQDKTVGDGKGSITISNATIGETYTIYKLFDATVSADNKSIAYTGDIPESLNTYFVKDTNGYISATKAATDGDKMSEGLKNALKEWTADATATATAESDGSVLNFTGLAFGYYVVTTSQGEQAISVDSTMPDVTIVDKNRSTPSDLTKTATATGTDKSFSIGDTVTYTVRFKTSNYDGAGKDAKKIVSYTIEDTLPDFLKDVKVTSIIVDNDGDEKTTTDQNQITVADHQFGADKKIVIDWYDDDNDKFLYNNGATIIITYTAVVTEKAAIDGNGNTNNVTVKWTTDDGTEPGPGKQLETDETIYTYAIALKKVNDKGVALPGAEFKFPFYVKSTDDEGVYIYAGKDAGEGLTNQITTPDSGVIVVKGVKSGDYVIEEVTAPAGYNKLTGSVIVKAVKTGATSTHTIVYLDENGDIVDTKTDKTTEVKVDIEKIAATAVVVVNKAGTQLPSTGGMGTTIFYVLGSALVLGAVVLLVTKKRMSDANR